MTQPPQHPLVIALSGWKETSLFRAGCALRWRGASGSGARTAPLPGRGNGERGWAGQERRTGALLSPAARVVWAPRTAPPHVLSTCAHSGFRRRRLPGPRTVPRCSAAGSVLPATEAKAGSSYMGLCSRGKRGHRA